MSRHEPGPDLRTRYLGLTLDTPLVASSGPLTRTVDSLLALQEAGAAAVVLPSLFAEEVEAAEAADVELFEETEAFAEFASAPLAAPLAAAPGAPDEHARRVREAKDALRIPVIASLNGATPGIWKRYARLLQDAGADALELNMYAVNADPTMSSDALESRYLRVIEQVRRCLHIPLAVKLSQHITGLSHFAAAAQSAGADALVLFNRFYGADLDLDDMSVHPRLELSTSWESLVALRWIAILRSQRADLGLAATSGVHEAADVVKALAVGADVACVASALMRHGPTHLSTLRAGLAGWLADHDYASVQELRGCMQADSVPDPGLFERAQYLRAIRA